MGKLFSNKYINSSLKLVLSAALVHIVVLSITFVATGDIKLFNIFNILDLNKYFPHIADGFLSDILSILIYILTYILILRQSRQPKKTINQR